MKQRIFLGIASILTLFVRFGIYTLWLFSRVGAALDVILGDNYQCVLVGIGLQSTSGKRSEFHFDLPDQ